MKKKIFLLFKKHSLLFDRASKIMLVCKVSQSEVEFEASYGGQLKMVLRAIFLKIFREKKFEALYLDEY